MYLGGISELDLMGRQVEPSKYYYVEQQQDLGQNLTQAKFAFVWTKIVPSNNHTKVRAKKWTLYCHRLR